jgi:hypothetical protein
MSLASLLLRIKTGFRANPHAANHVGLSANAIDDAKKPVYLRLLV